MVHDVTNDDALEDDLRALRSAPGLRPGPRCGTAAAMERIATTRPDLADTVEAAVNDPDVPAGAAAQFLTKHSGRFLKAAAVSYHRRRGTTYGCSCPREGL